MAPRNPEHMAKMRAARGGFIGETKLKTSRTVLTQKFVSALCEHFEKHGKDAIKIVYHEEPATYLKMVLSLCPREFSLEITDPLDGMSDDDLLTMLEKVRRLKEINPAPAPTPIPQLIEHNEHINGSDAQ